MDQRTELQEWDGCWIRPICTLTTFSLSINVHAALHISTPAAGAAGWQKVASMLENRVARGKENT